MTTAAPASSGPEPPAQHDARRQAILEAAFVTFCQYGFRRTAMEDIARASGLSRASLYLHYRNKQDIFQSLTQTYFDRTSSRIKAALLPGMPPSDALAAVFDAKAGPELEAILASPHGAELLDVKASSVADLVRDGEAAIAAQIADWLRSESAAERLTLGPFDKDPLGLAQTIIAALMGLKTADVGIAGYRADGRRLALLFGRALTL